MASDLASIAAAQTAGYTSTVLDRGASYSPASGRYEVTLEKHLVGYPGQASKRFRAFGQGASQAAAESQALASLNAQRGQRYGKGSANSGKSVHGDTLTDDLH